MPDPNSTTAKDAFDGFVIVCTIVSAIGISSPLWFQTWLKNRCLTEHLMSSSQCIFPSGRTADVCASCAAQGFTGHWPLVIGLATAVIGLGAFLGKLKDAVSGL